MSTRTSAFVSQFRPAALSCGIFFLVVLVGSEARAASSNGGAANSSRELSTGGLKRLAEVRQRAWRTAGEIAGVYERISPDKCPGIAALVQDIRNAQGLVHTEFGNDLDRLDAAALVTNNPHFWRAAWEISPTDGSLLLLQATLLASAGELGKARRILEATTQILPLSSEARPFYLAEACSVGSALTPEGRDDGMNRAGATGGSNAAALEQLILSHLKAGLEAIGTKRTISPADLEQVFRAEDPSINQLFALDSVRGAAFRGSADERREGRELRQQWGKLTDRDSILTYKEIDRMAGSLEAVGIPDLALLFHRLEVVARGFPAPSDLAAWHRLLPRLIGSAESGALFAAADRGEINLVEIDTSAPAAIADWKGDPAIHPLVMQQVQREIEDLSFRINVVKGSPATEAEMFHQRALQKGRAGLFVSALQDLETAILKSGRQPDYLLAEVGMYSSLGYGDRAETLLREVETNEAGRRLAFRERALLRFGEGRYAEALAALRDDVRKSPHAVYPALLAELAARQVGTHEPDLLKKIRGQVTQGSWPEACLGYLSGSLTDDALLERAQQGGTLEIAERLCEAYFILAEVALASGNRDKALDMFESCIGTGITSFAEFRLARLELRRLAPDREARTHLLGDEPERLAPHKKSGPQNTPSGEKWDEEEAPA